MLEVAVRALELILQPNVLMWLAIGTFVGMVFGLLPGLSGVVGMAVLLPLVFGMDATQGIALLLGMSAVTTTADTFPAVLLGVPGTSGSQATIVDGFPMARQGRAGEALSAAFTASMVGGIIGALALLVAIQFARPIVLALGSPHLFVLTLFGITMVAVVGRSALGISFLMAAVGFVLSTVGFARTTGEPRFTADITYFYDGIPIVLFALGLFAIPEILSLAREGQSIAQPGEAAVGQSAGILQGIRSVLRHKWLVVRNALIGTGLGMLPGTGGAIVGWVAYGTTAQLAKTDRDQFGHGDIRGVIAPEAANNAQEGGVLVPTMMFAIPGSASSAILLGGLVFMGINAGPGMVSEENLPFMVSLVWMLVLANILATSVSIAVSRPMMRLSYVSSRHLAAFVLAAVLFAAYQANGRWMDIVVVLVLGMIAWVFKWVGWPRVALIIGFVLGPQAENYLWLSITRYGMEWVLWPSIIAMGLLILVITFGTTMVGRLRAKTRAQ